jgi:hypothetical protein
MHRPAWLVSLAVIILLAGGCAKADGKMTVKEVTDALAQHKGDVAEPSANSTVMLPDNWGNGLRLVSNQSKQVTVNLPAPGGTPHKTANGIVVYLKDHSGGAVIPTKEGVQLLTVIKDANAPEEYVYTVRGGYFVLAGGGEVIVLDDKHEMQYVIPKPWAKDAKGKEMKTTFSVDPGGFLLTQRIQHIGATYPLTADPRWVERQWWGTVLHLTRSETQDRACAAQAGGVLFYWAPPAAAVTGGLGLWLQWIVENGNCLAVVVGTFIMWEERC